MALAGEAVSLWIGTLGMAAGMLYLLATARFVEDPEIEAYSVIAVFVPAIAGAAYLSMALGYGIVDVGIAGSVVEVHWARYADWMFTTPLLVLVLALLADADRRTVRTLVGLDLLMVAAGMLGAVSGPTARVVWWAVGTAALLGILYYLLGDLTAGADRRGEELARLFGRLRNLTAGVWLAYPVVWIAGTGGFGAVPPAAETATFVVLDLLAKVGFGAVLLGGREALAAAGSPVPAATTEE